MKCSIKRRNPQEAILEPLVIRDKAVDDTEIACNLRNLEITLTKLTHQELCKFTSSSNLTTIVFEEVSGLSQRSFYLALRNIGETLQKLELISCDFDEVKIGERYALDRLVPILSGLSQVYINASNCLSWSAIADRPVFGEAARRTGSITVVGVLGKVGMSSAFLMRLLKKTGWARICIFTDLGNLIEGCMNWADIERAWKLAKEIGVEFEWEGDPHL